MKYHRSSSTTTTSLMTITSTHSKHLGNMNKDNKIYEELWEFKPTSIMQTTRKTMTSCKLVSSIMQTIIRKSISLPLLTKLDPLLARQAEEEEFWKQVEEKQKTIQLLNYVEEALAEDNQTMNVAYVSNCKIKGRQLKEWKSYPRNWKILRDRNQ